MQKETGFRTALSSFGLHAELALTVGHPQDAAGLKYQEELVHGGRTTKEEPWNSCEESTATKFRKLRAMTQVEGNYYATCCLRCFTCVLCFNGSYSPPRYIVLTSFYR